MVVASYPFPPRNPANPNLSDVIYVNVQAHHPLYRSLFDRAQSTEAKMFQAQYQIVEETILHAFEYVAPASPNAATYSVQFGQIIKAACNVYELLSRKLYECFYNDRDDINIFNYLALDVHLDLSPMAIDPRPTLDPFGAYPEVRQPFRAIHGWDRMSPVTPAHIPAWWTAYNQIKHSNDGLPQHATLANALAAVAAIYCQLNKVYDCGIVTGGFVALPSDAPSVTSFEPLGPSRLFWRPR